MDRVEQILNTIALAVSRLLEPLAIGIEALHVVIRRQLTEFRVPMAWQGWLIAGLWTVLAVMVLRTLTGWLRIVFIVLTALVLTKVYGLLPA